MRTLIGIAAVLVAALIVFMIDAQRRGALDPSREAALTPRATDVDAIDRSAPDTAPRLASAGAGLWVLSWDQIGTTLPLALDVSPEGRACWGDDCWRSIAAPEALYATALLGGKESVAALEGLQSENATLRLSERASRLSVVFDLSDARVELTDGRQADVSTQQLLVSASLSARPSADGKSLNIELLRNMSTGAAQITAEPFDDPDANPDLARIISVNPAPLAWPIDRYMTSAAAAHWAARVAETAQAAADAKEWSADWRISGLSDDGVIIAAPA